MPVDIAVAHFTSPSITAYPWNPGFGTKYSDPGTLPVGHGYGVAFTPSGNAIAVGHTNSPYITAYPWNPGFGTKYSNPGTLPTGIGCDVTFNWSPFMRVNIGGTWKPAYEVYVKVGGTWKSATNVYVNVGGTWKQAV